MPDADGADEITTLERGGILTVRSLQQILVLYDRRSDRVGAMVPAAEGWRDVGSCWPAWAILAAIGGAIWTLSRHLESA